MKQKHFSHTQRGSFFVTTLIATALALCLSSGAGAATNSWIGTTTPANFTNTTFWSGGAVPGASDTALFSNTLSADISILWTAPVTNSNVSFDYQTTSSLRAFNLSNSNWYVTSRFAVEPSAGRTNFVRLQNNGSLNVTNVSRTAVLEVRSSGGRATLDIAGGTLNVDHLVATNNDSVTLSGGTLNVFGDSILLLTNASLANLNLGSGFNWNMLGGTSIVRLVSTRVIQPGSGAVMRVTGTGTVLDAQWVGMGGSAATKDDTLWIQDGGKAVISALIVGSNANVFGAAQNVFGSGLVVVTNGGVLQANQISTGLSGLGTVTVANATLEFTTNTPNIDLKTGGTFTLSSSTVSFRGVTNANFVSSKLTNVLFSGDNRLRLVQATNAMLGTYTFQTNNGQSFAFLNLQDGRFQSTNLLIGSGGRLTGSGVVNSFGVTNLGTIAPGESPGVLTFTSNLVLGASSVLAMEIGGTNSTLYDRIIVGGNLSVTGALNLILINAFSPTAGDTFTLIDNQGVNSIAGLLNGLTNNQFFDASQNGLDAFFRIHYDGGTGNDLVLVAVIPEPSSILWYGVVLALGMVLRRRHGRE